MRTRKMLRAFLKTCRAVQLLHACVVKFKVSGTVFTRFYIKLFFAVLIEMKIRQLVDLKCPGYSIAIK